MPSNSLRPPRHESTDPRSVLNSSTVTLVLAAVLGLEIIGGAIYASVRASQALEPRNLVLTAEEAIQDNYPEFRKTLKEKVHERGPEIARQASRELIASGPDAREFLTQVIARQMDRGLDEVTEISEDQFLAFVQENREQISQALDRLHDAPQEVEKVIVQMESSLEKQLGTDIQRQAKVALRAHRKINEKLAHLNDSKAALEPQELLERRMLRILRALAEEHVPELTTQTESGQTAS